VGSSEALIWEAGAGGGTVVEPGAEGDSEVSCLGLVARFASPARSGVVVAAPTATPAMITAMAAAEAAIHWLALMRRREECDGTRDEGMRTIIACTVLVPIRKSCTVLVPIRK
jgi:hypothetical protein